MSIDQETRDRILRELQEIRSQLPDLPEEDLLDVVAELYPGIVRDPYYHPTSAEEAPPRRDSASTRIAS